MKWCLRVSSSSNVSSLLPLGSVIVSTRSGPCPLELTSMMAIEIRVSYNVERNQKLTLHALCEMLQEADSLGCIEVVAEIHLLGVDSHECSSGNQECFEQII